MKTLASTLVATLALTRIPLPLSAADQFWDPDGSNPGTGISGNWDSDTTNWTSGFDFSDNTIWGQGNNANFNVASNYTVVVTEPITVGNITVTGAAGTLIIDRLGGNGLTLGGAAVFSNARAVSLLAPIDGAFPLTKSGGGTLTISSTNTYSGGTTLSGGTVAIGVDSQTSDGVITSGPFGTGEITTLTAQTTLQASGAPRVLYNPVTLNIQLNISGSQPLTFTNGDFKLNGGNRNLSTTSTADVILGGNLTDDGIARTLTKQGTGRVIMAGGDAGYLGGITASAGTLAAGNSAPFPTNNNNIITLNGGTLDLNGFDVRLSRLSGNSSGRVLLGSHTLTIVNNGPSGQTFSGVIGGTGGLVKDGGISQVLSGTNTFTGGILVMDGPLYLPTNGLGSPYSLGAGPNTITITNTGWWGANVIGLSIVTNKVVLANAGPTAKLDPAGASTVIWEQAGEITGTGGLLRSSAKGTGVVILSGSNSFSGGVEMDARGILLGNPYALGTGLLRIGDPANPPSVSNPIYLGATVDLTGSNAVTNPLTVNQGFTFNSTVAPAPFGLELAGPVTLTNGGQVVSVTGSGLAQFSGVISGSGGITKDGFDKLTLSANNTYTGSTAISNGTLALIGSGSVAGSSSLAVLSGATLDASGRTDGTLTVGAAQTLRGSGTIVGALIIAGVLAPGDLAQDSIGMLTVNGNLSLSHQAVFEIDKSQVPMADFVSVSGTVTGGGTLVVTNAGAGLLATNDIFPLFSQPVAGFTTISLPPGYAWDNQLATSGTIQVIGTTFPTSPGNISSSLSGGNLNLAWPANYAGGWVLDTSTDLATWTMVPGTRDISSVSIPISLDQPDAFFRLRLLTP